MKKTQKKLGNKGFSLVELIVVIAIMAVLVGVLAPTLIKNIEKSRESKDAKSSVEVALQDETAYDEAVPTGSTASTNSLVTLTSATASVNTSYSSFKSEFDGIMSVSNTKLTSKKYKSATVTFTVNEKGQVNVVESGVN